MARALTGPASLGFLWPFVIGFILAGFRRSIEPSVGELEVVTVGACGEPLE